jgi:HK97 family phage portal protein
MRMAISRFLYRMAIKTAGISPRDPSSVSVFGTPSENLSGVEVSETTAFNCSLVWAAVQVLASGMACLPCGLFKRIDGSRSEQVNDMHAPLIAVAPNPEMTWAVFVETLQAHVLTWGNAYAEIERDQKNRIIALWPITPNRVTPARDKQKRLVYVVENPATPSLPWVLDSARVWHLPGLGFDGLVGYNVIRMARLSLGLTMAAEQYGAAFFGNGSHPTGIVTTDKRYNEEAIENFREQFAMKHGGGPQSAHRLVFLSDGMTWQQMTVNPDHAQLLETRKFQAEEVARWFNIAPHLLRHLERSTNNNIEQQSLEHVIYTLGPWRNKWEAELNRKLLTPEQQKLYFHRFDPSPLLRGDLLSFVKALDIGRRSGLWSADDCRAKLCENPIADGKGEIYLQAANYNDVEDVINGTAGTAGGSGPGVPGSEQ